MLDQRRTQALEMDDHLQTLLQLSLHPNDKSLNKGHIETAKTKKPFLKTKKDFGAQAELCLCHSLLKFGGSSTADGDAMGCWKLPKSASFSLV